MDEEKKELIELYYRSLDELISSDRYADYVGDSVMLLVLQLNANKIKLPKLTQLEIKKLVSYVSNLLIRTWNATKDNVMMFSIRSAIQILLNNNSDFKESLYKFENLYRLDSELSVFNSARSPKHLDPVEHFWWSSNINDRYRQNDNDDNTNEEGRVADRKI